MSKHVTRMTIEDAEHYTPEERKVIIASYPVHERDARTKGIPILGSGRIFPIEQEIIQIDAIDIPAYWPEIGGLDFGWDHPTAGVKLAWDRDNDIVYVTAAYKQKENTPVIHAAALKPWGSELLWAWPHDGYKHDTGSGKELASQYEDQGLNMLPEHATFEDGGFGVEAGLMDMYDRMRTGRLKVFKHLLDWFSEFLLYHRKDGRVVKEFDDLMSATRYAIMMLRFARALYEPDIDIEPMGESSWMG
ncbi:MAG: terminase [Nitrospinae bacterium]|nr:terminase [Nitrospinota bacterium]